LHTIWLIILTVKVMEGFTCLWNECILSRQKPLPPLHCVDIIHTKQSEYPYLLVLRG